MDSVSQLDEVEPGAVLRSPNEPVIQPEPVAQPGTDPVAAVPTGEQAWPWANQSIGTHGGFAPPTVVAIDRLYRSSGVNDHPEAASPFGAAAPTTGVMSAVVTPEATPIAPVSPQAAVAFATYSPPPEAVQMSEDKGRFGTILVFLLITGLTTIAGFYDMARNAQLTWITGATFIAACLMASLAVRRRDLWVGVITPPLAFLVALVASGQPSTISGAGSLPLREVSLIATGLAFNAPYIFGGTALALVVVLIRRSGFRRRDRIGS